MIRDRLLQLPKNEGRNFQIQSHLSHDMAASTATPFSMKGAPVDHVIPEADGKRSPGRLLTDGFSSWKNLCAPAAGATAGRENRLMIVSGWALLRNPFEPE